MSGPFPRRTFLQHLALSGPLASAILASDATEGVKGDRKPAQTLPELPYKFNALDPYIDEQTMRIHHAKHHAGYVNNFNKESGGSSSRVEYLDEWFIG